jgi:hypothetical protein
MRFPSTKEHFHQARRTRCPRFTSSGRQHLPRSSFIGGLTDFGPGRSEIFPNSADDDLKVHHKGVRDADVTEGSGGIWERLHYDWSDPNHVTLTTTDSNTWGGASGYVYTLSPHPDGTTNVDVVIVREGKNFKDASWRPSSAPSARAY